MLVRENAMKESRGITPLRTILQNYLNHIENLETNPSTSDNYDKEFQDLKQFSEALKTQKEYSCTEGEKEVNKKKNRYKDILPFNISRVVLSEYAGIPGSDYINANFIKGASGSPAYIASQGPLPNTVNDFWRMVVECEVQVIVMACNAQESGKHKCENYWVEKEGEEKRFGMVQICLVKASIVCPDFLVRTMRLKYTNDKDVTEERTVCQFHYSAWPDHGVPPLVRPLLDMVRLMRDTQASETLPVLVHCSAGCGRTGTICAIDFVWGLLRAGKLTEEFSLFNLVKEMRKQRVAMVQTKEQYILVHQAVRELFKEQLRVIESHPYENIDFNGVPLIKDFEEPFYDTISIQKEDNCDEKQDKSEMKDKGEDSDRVTKTDTAPPLPRKKRPSVLFSKQEKDAENLTEKNRSFFVEKEREKTDASFSSLLGKPRIVKLRAFFEKSQMTKERGGLKDRGSQTVSRSHSLGAIRKPLSPEVFESQEKAKPNPASSDTGKLKHSKSFSKSVPLIKRSKSLKTFSQSSHLCVSPEETVILKNYRKSFEEEVDYKMWKNSNQHESKRRRSLESLMGDVQPSVTWPRGVDDKSDLKTRQKSLDWSPKLTPAPSSKTADILRYQLQKLSLEKEKKINSFGIGIRERRNSFRQAVNKNNVQMYENAKGVDQPDGACDRNCKLQDKSNMRKQSLKQLERAPKYVLTKDSSSKNLFLKKLNSEIYDSQRDGCHSETRSRIGYEESDKGSRHNPILVLSDSKGTLFKTNVTIKPSEVDGSNGKDSERTYQPVWENLQQRPPKSYECYKCYVTSKPSQLSSYQRPIYSHKPLSYQNSVNSSLKEQFYLVHKKVPTKETEVTFSSYRKTAELYTIDGNDKNMALSPKLGTGRNNKTYEHVWCHPGPSRSSGEISSSEHSSDSSRLCLFEGEGPAKGEVKLIIKPEPIRSRKGDKSKVNEQFGKQKKSEEFTPNSVEFCNYGVVGASKVSLNTGEYSKDDFLLKEPTAPPRVKRHASITVPRNALNGSDRIVSWVSAENEAVPVRSLNLQPDKNAWNGTIGVDLDAVAASMQQDKKGINSMLKDGIWSGMNNLTTSTTSNLKKKQHYL